MGGITMEAKEYWKIFAETGAPEWYVMYTQALRSEKEYVSKDARTGNTNQ